MQTFAYCLPLKSPLRLPGGEPILDRRGILLHDEITGGWGDAAPLPGVSRETLAEVKAAIQSGDWHCADTPSLRFAVSCVQKPWAPPESPVACNGLWIVETESVEEVARRIRSWPHPVLKVKPGAVPDVEALNALIRRHPGIRFRLDGNRQWTLDQTLTTMNALPENAVEYVEEPLRQGGDYNALWERMPVPVALDESLLEPGGAELARKDGVVALVLKPTLLGGEGDWSRWVDLAKQEGKQVIWSSCFESGVGLWHLARLACGGAPAGLDTGAWLDRDLVAPRPLPEQGEIPATEHLEVLTSLCCN